jgi:hypothetical protein
MIKMHYIAYDLMVNINTVYIMKISMDFIRSIYMCVFLGLEDLMFRISFYGVDE